MKNFSAVRSPALLAASIMAFSSYTLPVLAQQSNTPDTVDNTGAAVAVPDSLATPLESMIVTGSHIRETAADGSSPVIIFEKEDIERTGVATLPQFFEKLPQNFGGGANGANVANLGLDRDTANNFGQGTSINLRGLGTGTTLTLINGHRVASSNRYQYVDVSLIPMSAVERVEILTDGASAIYGADAIGGVVNIILRQDFIGYETSARYGTTTSGGMNEYQASQAGGWAWDGGHLLATYEYMKQGSLSATDRSFSENVTVKPYDLYPASERNSLYVDGSQQLSDILTLTLTGTYAKRDVETTISGTADETRLFPQTRQYDLFAGLTLDLPREWQARLNAGYGKNTVRYERTTITGTSAATARPTDMRSETRYLELIADGELISLPAGPLRAAFGSSIRRDGYDFVDYRGLERPYDVHRNITSVFGELNVPLLRDLPGIRKLSLTAAGRYDDYSDFGSTANPKFGLQWEVNEDLTLRSTYGRSYRAPVYQDMQPNNTVVVSRIPNPNSPSGNTVLMMLGNGNPDLGPERAKTWTAGFSFTPRVLPGLKVDANYYHITYKNRIDNGYPGSFTSLFQGATAAYSDILTFNPTPEQIQNARQLGTSGLGMFVSRVGPYALPLGMDENSTEVILDNRFRNNASTTQRGVDLDTSYAFGVGQTDVALSLAGQYIIESKRRVTSSAPEVNALNDVYLPVDLKLRGGIALNRQQLAMGLFVNYADNYHDSSNPNDPHVSSWTTVDLNIGYRFAPSLWPKGETLLAFNVQNIFDRDPPFVVNSINTGYDPTNATALGRFVSMSLTHQW
ncbi:TonB-dependent receptor plug domain-containing protein [Pseudomonas aeruginosa]|uniref:TonB-dependent receptor plug domain-containing protein n=1 Tax=Pseudomonas aeruginosa TaxID=287 RepID=UPI000F8161CB|nr:TonB-dependent receptor [Pseudomonas aeruginosa]MBG4922320.1 TonB-dependent receptor [Pseudomonas aeruginosa]MBG5864623.1 TonB-dependent receptor [Pseudomonas aeruginosa]RTX35853.1 TonB-dependent receptor [Pseudomonas aeruginosa]HDU8925423.1 TonB-dependent receptor [Pseudomonas aeruginosa]HDU9094082.1 TonB-dependent receptor [Pseudomonas aeruginosa]